MTAALVPSNHRLREHALAEVLAPLKAISPAAIEQVWNAWSCPAPLLPYLAYALSVDFWDDGWDEIKRRRVIAESPVYHRRKGTRGAVEDATAYTGRSATILEWHEFAPPRRRGTFQVTVHLDEVETAAPADELALLRRLVRSAKPKSRAFTLQAARLQVMTAPVGVGVMAGTGAVLTVPPDDLETGFSPFVFLQAGAGASLEVQ